MDSEHTQYLIVPGWHGSEAEHWQSHWQHTLPGAHRVEQRDWIEPQLHEWVETLDRKIRAMKGRQIILVAHSLGCVTVAQWARIADASVLRRMGGALLVAPADVERDNAAQALRNFGPVPLEHLPFPSVLVGSTNDPAASAERAILFGRAWGSKIAMLAAAGHINVRSGHTTWESGFRYLYQLQQLISTRGVTHIRRPLRAPSILLSPALLLPQSAQHASNNDRLRVAL
jgi:predicted alpha/beta hydrolase family esterase